MAILSSDQQYVTVEKGDCLWTIAKEHLGSATKYPTLANINGKKYPYLIYVGEKIYLYAKPSSSSSSTSSNSNKVTIKSFGLQADTDNTLFVTWEWSKSDTDSYLVEWSYYTSNELWFIGNSGNITIDEDNPDASKQSTYNIPSNALQVRVRIKPIAKTKTGSNNNETKYWTAEWSSYKTWTDKTILATPNTPAIEIKKYKLTTSLENINIKGAKYIEFQVYKNSGGTPDSGRAKRYKTSKVTITATNTASYQCTVDAGNEYSVRCRALGNNSEVSEWSAYTNTVKTVPAASSGITTIRANSENSIYLEWAASDTADTYDIEYATKESYFDNTDQTSIKSGIEFTHFEFVGLELGEQYFFRVRAVNQNGESAWSGIKSIIIGEKPTAPTTWSSTTTAISGEDITLYWVHNSADNSSQTYAELELTVNGTTLSAITIKNTTNDDEKDKTSHVVIDTTNAVVKWTEDDGNKTRLIDTSLIEGVKLQWRVRTAGITKQYGDWSVQRVIDIYAPATLEFHITDIDGEDFDTLTSFPWYVYGLPGPNTQIPLSYHVTVTANESYVTTDNMGNEKNVAKGSAVYSEHFDISNALLLEMLPNVIDLENGISYTVTCVVSMDSGLNATESREFTVSWTDEIYTPNAEIGYDPEQYITTIRPYCYDYQIKYYKVDWANNVYTTTSEEIDDLTISGVYTETGEEVFVGLLPNGLERYYCGVYVNENEELIDPEYYIVDYSSGTYTKTANVVQKSNLTNVKTSTGETVLMGINSNGDEIRYCITEGTVLVDDITLSVYRREYDGRFIEIATGLKNIQGTTVTDPHPALDYARYRVVAISEITGAVSFYDIPGYPINEVGIIIQWDEEWSTFDTDETSELSQPPWSGSLLRLPYNIDVGESNNIDVTHIEYAGRQHPVSYHGTHLGTSGSWKVDIPYNDKDTIYALRRLMIYTGDVYVREPSGVGYWATIKVSFNKTHCNVAIPVSLDITRVEGGV